MLKHIPRRLCSDRYVSAVNSRGRHRATATLLPSHAPRTGMSEMGIQHDLEAIWRQLEDCERTLKRGDAAGARRELDDAVWKLNDIERRATADSSGPRHGVSCKGR